MSTAHNEQVRLPHWLRVAIKNSDPPDEPLARRREPRGSCSGIFATRPGGVPEAEKMLLRATDISSGGVQCIGRWMLPIDTVVDLVPSEEEGNPVRVRVIHCAETRQGYRIGFAFLGEAVP